MGKSAVSRLNRLKDLFSGLPAEDKHDFLQWAEKEAASEPKELDMNEGVCQPDEEGRILSDEALLSIPPYLRRT